MGHLKTDRLLQVAERLRVPVVLLAEGGGGRPGDTDVPVVSGLHTPTFAAWAGLSGLVPRIGVAAGPLLRRQRRPARVRRPGGRHPPATLGMGGPAMVEGGGLGTYAPEEIGPVEVHVAERRRRRRSSTTTRPPCAPCGPCWAASRARCPRRSRTTRPRCATCCPAERTRAYDVREVLAVLADPGSVLELRPGFAPGMVTALVRLDGGPSACWPTTRGTSAARSPATARTRRPGSSRSATPSTCRCSAWSTRPASWSARRRRRPGWCGTAAGCSSRPRA